MAEVLVEGEGSGRSYGAGDCPEIASSSLAAAREVVWQPLEDVT